MKKHNLVILIVFVFLAAVAMPLTSNDSFTVFTYDMAQPFGDLKEATPDFSWRGWSFSYRNLIRDQLSVGLSVGWQGFNRMESGTYESGPVSATGTFIRRINAIPLMAIAHMYTGESGGMRLYGGLGIGTFYMQERYEYGIFYFYEDHWHFGLVPEAGVTSEVRIVVAFTLVCSGVGPHHRVGSTGTQRIACSGPYEGVPGLIGVSSAGPCPSQRGSP